MLGNSILIEALLYWLLLIVAAGSVVLVAGKKRIASLIILSPIVLFSTLMIMQGASYTISNGIQQEDVRGISHTLAVALSGIFFVVAIIIVLVKRRGGKPSEPSKSSS